MEYTAFTELDNKGKRLCLSPVTKERALAASRGYAPEVLSQDEGTPDLGAKGSYYRDPVETSGVAVRAAVARSGYWNWDTGFPWKDASPLVRKAGADYALAHPGGDSDKRLRVGVEHELEEQSDYFRCACAYNGYFLDLFRASMRTLEPWGGVTEARLCEDYLLKESFRAGTKVHGRTFDELYRSWLASVPQERLWFGKSRDSSQESKSSI